MAQFRIEIAGKVFDVRSLFDSTRDYCRKYLTEKEPDCSLEIAPADLDFEQQDAYEEALREGFRPRKFTDPFLDRAAIQRKAAEFLFDHNTLLFHGSALAVDGQGYLFTAKSGTGKSTHTRYWREVFGSRAVMVNDDKPFLRIMENEVLLCGAPWSGKHGLDENISVPLKGICILQRGSENAICPIPAAEALPRLLHETIAPLAPGKEERFQELVTLLAETVPLWRMDCTKDPQAAKIAWEAMSQ